MGGRNLTNLLNLTTEKILYSVRVRAQAVWKGINRTTNEFRGFNIIFTDEQICRIHAFISDKLSDSFAQELKEDVIGILETSTAHYFPGKDDPTKSHIKFKLSDGSYEVNVTLFNDFGQNFERAMKKLKDKKVVVILSSAKVNKYGANQEINLTNYPATRYYIQPDHYAVKILLNSISAATVEEEQDPPIYTIKQIKQFTTDFAEKKVLCCVVVKKIENECKWYENFHVQCDKEVSIVDGRYWRNECKRNLPCPDKRFSLCMVCSDGTGFLPIIFPDDEIQKILGKNVYELENENHELYED
ncbi:uncharacterized protein LOC141714929 [Apium graveolens]|uniref:uncharacterized protein LOC141714929 n=1 Tax=Apium graveolens TaxID=4045 RepID=UPI003D7BB55C